MFSRILVANRGEIAVRVIRAIHELGAEAVAVYSTADHDALHVRLADRAVCIGPPSSSESYLRISNVIAAAETTGCEAIHPGYGFLSENPAFVRACEENDLVFVGPGCGRHGADGRQGARQGRDEGGRRAARARHRGWCLAGRGANRRGRAGLSGPAEGGLRRRRQGHAARARTRGARGRVLHRARGGRRRLFRRVPLPREGTRPCAPRRGPGALRQGRGRADTRRARMLDPAATPEARRGVSLAGSGSGHARGDGVGSGARVPHDRLRERWHVRVPARAGRHVPLHRAERTPSGRAPGQRGRDRASTSSASSCASRAGQPLPVTGRASRRGHAIEIRLNAEDPAKGFAPAPGTIKRFRPPLGPGVRIDTHLEEGSTISPYYDSLVAKLVVWAEDRPAAIARCLRALGEIELGGIPTTRELALDILRSDEFVSGEYSTSFLEEMGSRLPALAGVDAT